jgi:hypothetical protein
MPPSLSRSSLSSVKRIQSSASSIPLRRFSSTPSRCLIRPEDPKFIEVPEPPQQQIRTKSKIKGTLPPPRNIFPNGARDKTSKEYFDDVTPEPKDLSEPANDIVAWKRRMAESRRRNLRDGLILLRQRKDKSDQGVAERSLRKEVEREERLNAPQREDERLTSATITKANSTLQSGPVPDPQRGTRLAESAAKVKALQLARQEQRRDALHNLYMHARTFITTEEQLNATVDEIFTDMPFDKNNQNDNIWDMKGAPPTVYDMLAEVNRTQARAVKLHQGSSVVGTSRMKKIAEELTGGKMDLVD